MRRTRRLRPGIRRRSCGHLMVATAEPRKRMAKPVSELGRPSTYTAELAATICARLATGETLRAVCRDDGMPSESTVRTWALDDREGFSAHYARAREIGYMA